MWQSLPASLLHSFNTSGSTQERSPMSVVSVAGAFSQSFSPPHRTPEDSHQGKPMGATNVENPSATAHRSASTRGHTLGKSPHECQDCGKSQGRAPTSLSTGGSTQERSYMSAGTVGRPSHTASSLPSTRELILGRPIPVCVLGPNKALSHSTSATIFDPVILPDKNSTL